MLFLLCARPIAAQDAQRYPLEPYVPAEVPADSSAPPAQPPTTEPAPGPSEAVGGPAPAQAEAHAAQPQDDAVAAQDAERARAAQVVPPQSMAALAATLPAPTPDKAQTSGLGVGTGIGPENFFFGGHVIYYQQLAHPKWRVAFHLGAGVMPMFNTVPWGMVGGAFLSFGMRHRLTMGLHGGIENYQSYSLHGAHWEDRPVSGAGMAIGYELMTEGGFYLRVNAGPSFHVKRKTPFYERHVGWDVTVNLLSLGYKIW